MEIIHIFVQKEICVKKQTLPWKIHYHVFLIMIFHPLEKRYRTCHQLMYVDVPYKRIADYLLDTRFINSIFLPQYWPTFLIISDLILYCFVKDPWIILCALLLYWINWSSQKIACNPKIGNLQDIYSWFRSWIRFSFIWRK